jgi:hypothetical protein
MGAPTVGRVLLLASLVVSPAARAATIPPDLEAHAAGLRRQASPQLLAWAHDRGLALARSRVPVDLAALEQSVRSQLSRKPAPAAGGVVRYAGLGAVRDADVMAVCFITLAEAWESAQEDLKTIMDGVKLINKEKDAVRSEMNTVNKLAAANAGVTPAPTPTAPPDRVSQLVSAARSIQGRTFGASLTTLVAR